MYDDLAPHDCPAIELGRRLREGELNAQELTEYFIARIQACDDKAVFISTTFERARREAEQSARRYSRAVPAGPLDGVPIAWKDVFDVAGAVTTAGTPIFREQIPASRDAGIVRQLSRAGMVTLGKTNLTQFANSAIGANPYFGTPINPVATDQPRVPGGSSSGSAVAVARGLVPVAVGTDTGGSVRTPASFNGTVGFKASKGRYTSSGIFPLARSLDTIGFITRHVDDCGVLDAAGRFATLEDASQHPSRQQALDRHPLYVPENILSWADADVRDRLDTLRGLLIDAGYRVISVDIPEFEVMQSVMKQRGGISLAEAYWEHREWIEGRDAHLIDPFVRNRMLRGKHMSACDLLALQKLQAECTRSVWARIWPGVLMMPTVPHVAPTFAQVSDESCFTYLNERTTCFTVLISLLDGCSLSLPCGRGMASMPIGISINLPGGNEQRLLRLGARIAQLYESVAVTRD